MHDIAAIIKNAIAAILVPDIKVDLTRSRRKSHLVARIAVATIRIANTSRTNGTAHGDFIPAGAAASAARVTMASARAIS
jgi:hypothetical protein